MKIVWALIGIAMFTGVPVPARAWEEPPWGTYTVTARSLQGWRYCEDLAHPVSAPGRLAAPPAKDPLIIHILGDSYCVIESTVGDVPVTARYWYRSRGTPPNAGLHLVTVRFENTRYDQVRAWLMAAYGEPAKVTMEPWVIYDVPGRAERVWWAGPTTSAILSLKPLFGPTTLDREAGHPVLVIMPNGWAPP